MKIYSKNRRTAKRIARSIKRRFIIKTLQQTIAQQQFAQKQNESLSQQFESYQEEQDDEFIYDEQDIQTEEFQQGKMLDIPIPYIAMLSKRERENLRKEFPTMPEYIFMSASEKKSYFAKKYENYNKKLANESRILKHNHQKKVKFVNAVEVKTFRIKDTPEVIKDSKSHLSKHSIFSTRTY